jgi:hypothetical protein
MIHPFDFALLRSGQAYHDSRYHRFQRPHAYPFNLVIFFNYLTSLQMDRKLLTLIQESEIDLRYWPIFHL